MSRETPCVLVVDDDEDFTSLLRRVLEDDYGVLCAGTGAECLRLLEKEDVDIVVLDLKLPDAGGLTVLRRMSQSGHEVPVVLITAYGDVDSAVKAIQLGAADYMEKPLGLDRFRELLADLCRKTGAHDPPIRKHIVGECPRIRALWQSVRQFGSTDLPILLQGETGTGKDLVARALHEVSRRSGKPFVAIDCAALPETLIDSELFGYEAGAFTGAERDKPGQIEWADGGTLFLDEVGELPQSSQAKLLRVLEEKAFTPLGAGTRGTRRVDVRVLSATNRNLVEAVGQGEFRRDLYYRLAGATLQLPALRVRGSDIGLLACHFLRKYRKQYKKPGLDLSEEALRLLERYHWPGNVRELDHTIGSLAAKTSGVIRHEHIRAHFEGTERRPLEQLRPEEDSVMVSVTKKVDFDVPVDLKEATREVAREAEKQLVRAALETRNGTQEELGAFLNVDPKTLRRILKGL